MNYRALLGTAAFSLITTALLSASPAMAAPAGEVLGAGNFIHLIAHLDKTIAFYHDVLGLDVQTFGVAPPQPPKFAPNIPVAQLYAVPSSTPQGVAVLRLPERGIGLEFAEFRNVDQRNVRPKPQDPGAAVLVLDVRNLDAIVDKVHTAQVPIVTTGGMPVVSSDSTGKARSIVVTDPDGYFIELVEHDPLPEGGAEGNVLSAHLMLAIANTDGTVHYYRDLLGLSMQVDTAFAADAALSKTLGVRHAQFRHSIATVPGSDFKYDFVEWKGVARHPAGARVFDHGVVVLRLAVSDVDMLVSQLKADGVHVASTGDGPVALNARVHACILADPSGMYIEPVPRPQPRRPQAPTQAQAQAPRAQ